MPLTPGFPSDFIRRAALKLKSLYGSLMTPLTTDTRSSPTPSPINETPETGGYGPVRKGCLVWLLGTF